jgi:16S rRNA (uracil1498-N3)-methyltransferase
LLLVVGPEGGLTESESLLLRSEGAREVGLGPRRLRSETAAAALLSVARPLFDPPQAEAPPEKGLDTGREPPL